MKQFKRISLVAVLALTMVVNVMPVAPAFAAEVAPEDVAVDDVVVADAAVVVEEGKIYDAKAEILSKKTGKPPKKGIEEVAKYVKKDGTEMATIVFKSTAYTKVVVDGVTYFNENEGGASTFTVPVKLDTQIEIVGTTVAMSSPKDISYLLTIFSEGMKLAEGQEPVIPAPAPEEALKEGVYLAKDPGKITEGNKMFRCVKAALKVDKNGKPVSVDIYLSGTGYTDLYVGKVKEGAIAKDNPDGLWTTDEIPVEKRIPHQVQVGGELDGKFFFTVPVTELDVTMDIGALSAKYGLWGAKFFKLDKDNFEFDSASAPIEPETPAPVEPEKPAPEKPANPDAPNTGDAQDLAPWAILLVGAAALIPVVRRKMNK